MDDFPIFSLQQFYQQIFGAQFRVRPHNSSFTVGTTAVAITPPSSPALGITFSNTGATNIAIRTAQTVTITTGILLLPGGSVDVKWYEDFDMLSYDWFAISSAGGGTLFVVQRILSGV